MARLPSITRRSFLKLTGLAAASLCLAACNKKTDASPLTEVSQSTLTPKRSVSMTTQPSSDQLLLFVGAYTKNLGFVDGSAKGISVFSMNLADGKLDFVTENAGIESPSYLTFHPNLRYLYAANESSGFVSAFLLDADQPGHLTLLNQQSTQGSAPCFVSTDKTGKMALVSNYSSGNVLAYPIESDGKLGNASINIQHQGSGPDRPRQAGPHAHSIWVESGNRFALACDLGLDKVFVYALDPQNAGLAAHSEGIIHPGAGPRHLDFHPNGRFIYVINELDATMSTLSWDSQAGELKEIQVISTLPAGVEGPKSCADVHIHPSGKFLYGSNRGHDSIVIYAVDETTGKISLIGHESTRGKTPRNFTLDPTSRYLLAANQDSGSIVTFQIDPQTGKLAYLATTQSPAPVCLKFLPG